MKIGDRWFIDEVGMITCLKCNFSTWADNHRCWEWENLSQFTDVKHPMIVMAVATILYDKWRLYS